MDIGSVVNRRSQAPGEVGEFGVESTCRAPQFAPTAYWSAKRRPTSARSERDAALGVVMARAHAENFGDYLHV